PANARESLIEANLEEQEGSDFMMIKPALSYLDFIEVINKKTNLPVAAYNVSGEYAMVKAAAEKKWLDGNRVMNEILLSIKRAGADTILTYFAKEFAEQKK
ncbi:MAG: porphobilinogen synthase, partial [Chryseotalea sp.]